MGLKPPQVPPQNQRDWDQWARNTPVVPDPNAVTTVTVKDKAVTNAKLRDSAPASVIGRLQSTPGQPADITASVNDTFLARRSGVLTFSGLADGDIPGTIARQSYVDSGDAAVTAAFQAADTALGLLITALTPLTGSATYNPPSLVDGTGTTTTVTCTGAVLGGFARASFSLDLQGITVTAYVSATDTVSVRFQNESGGTLDLSSGTLFVRVDP